MGESSKYENKGENTRLIVCVIRCKEFVCKIPKMCAYKSMCTVALNMVGGISAKVGPTSQTIQCI